MATGAIGRAVLAGSLWLLTNVAANPQTTFGAAYNYTAMIEEICQQYAKAPSQLPSSQMFGLCMSERRCHLISGSSHYQCEAPGPYTWHGGGY